MSDRTDKQEGTGNAAARRAWIAAVLGLELPEPVPAAAEQWEAARADVLAAAEGAREQVERLRAAMRKEPELAPVADFTLDGTDAAEAALLAALPARWPGSADAAARAKTSAAAAIKAFRGTLDGDEVVTACEDNPLGVPVVIRRGYSRALSGLSAILAAL